MDDQGTNREGGGSVSPRFQFSLGRLFEMMFWGCLFVGSLSIVAVRFYNAFYVDNLDDINRMLRDENQPLRMAVAIATAIVSPCVAVGTILNRPIVGAVVGLVLGLLFVALTK
jgi:hypothetical protein